MPWTTIDDPSGFAIQIPEGWQLKRHPAQAVVITSPDGTMLALVQHIADPIPGTPAEILQFGRFPTSAIFHRATPGPIEPATDGGAACTLTLPLQDGTPAKARLSCHPAPGGATLLAYAAPEAHFGEAEPSLRWIVESFKPSAGWPGPAPATNYVTGDAAMAATLPDDAPPLYTRYTDPQLGTFTVDVPRGWQVRGGVAHPTVGDRRPWVAMLSPDGISIAYGDPDFPQCFYHVPLQIEGMMIPYATGCVFMNLKPGAERLAREYLKTAGARHFGPLQLTTHRDRRDVIDRALATARQAGTPIPSSIELVAHEVSFQAGARSGNCLGASVVNKQMSFGFGTMWEGNVTVWMAPPALMARAEAIAMHVIESYRPTPRMQQLVQQDEAIIAGNGAAANIGQQSWFAAQQAGHQAQLGFGDAIMGNYWSQQQSNDSLMQGYTNRQQSEDRVFEQYSEATRDRQRMTDDSMGKSYEVASGSNYYWVDQQSGQVIGTNTDQPPDYQRNYTQLRKE